MHSVYILQRVAGIRLMSNADVLEFGQLMSYTTGDLRGTVFWNIGICSDSLNFH